MSGMEVSIVKSVQEANIRQQERFAKRIADFFAGREEETVLAVRGPAFEVKTDDVRESPAINCIRRFLDSGMKINAYDPEATAAARRALEKKIERFRNGYDALDDTDALVMFTDRQEFRNPGFEVIASKPRKCVIFGGRNLYDQDVIRRTGIEYYSVGRPPVLP